MGSIAGPSKITNRKLVFAVDSKDPNSFKGSGTNWHDMANDIGGTFTNGASGSLSNGYATFDGSNDFCTFGNQPSTQMSDAFSADIWVRPHALDQDTTVMGRDNGSNRQWWIYLQNNESIWFSIEDVGNCQSDYGEDDEKYTANNWFHICGTYDGSTQVLYINGLNANGQPSKTNSSASGTVYQGTAALNLGNRDNNDRHFDGDIACARMYNRALTQAEVLHNFNTQRTRFGVDPY